jgi:large subunit ribosomal protein L15
MQIHQLALKSPAKSRKRIGRGGKRGTYSGHGGKGQTARAGRNFRPIIREVLKRYPKLRGYKNHRVGLDASVVNIKSLEIKFEKGEKVNPRILVERNLVPRVGGKYPQIKILGTGKLSKNLKIEGCEISAAAREKIEKAGGSIK